ncbi:GNAT family N-acetyltransferase [Nostoc sp. UCD121]|uniref:GNAT family N-acetyltransferase n=1 Tax=unclassified Nostoc TaxID=2593658 RepID=UPI001629AC2C|nr:MULTISPECIES: GNAT family N-acetyltransferase [unclassified Nostoc]MBC1219193.1 GNAT family N-acetyltransferase [Nostoc sp. UCD120]MBC1278452.1 GNAT family N-acetyltransferase [Nostoc sp. UCD121]MBC1297797.1 GNAT family N-acetyltransferase [Nostoc sp. UCD122]
MLTQVACDKKSWFTHYNAQGFTFEAVKALVNFAFTGRELKRIIAHSPDERVASICILKKLAMRQIASDGKLLKWELKLESRQL